MSVLKKVNRCLHLLIRSLLRTEWIISDNIRDSNGKYLKIIYVMDLLVISNLFFIKEPLFQSIQKLIPKECSGKYLFLSETIFQNVFLVGTRFISHLNNVWIWKLETSWLLIFGAVEVTITDGMSGVLYHHSHHDCTIWMEPEAKLDVIHNDVIGERDDVRGKIIETDIIRKDCSVLPIILKLIHGTYLWRYFQISFGRKICEPNCASFPAWKSTPATVWFLSPTMESNADCWAPSVPLFTTIKRTQESSDGLFFTEENTRRVSGNWIFYLYAFRQVFVSSQNLEDSFYTDVIFVQKPA